MNNYEDAAMSPHLKAYKDSPLFTELHWAVKCMQPETVEFLLFTKGVQNVTACDMDGSFLEPKPDFTVWLG